MISFRIEKMGLSDSLIDEVRTKLDIANKDDIGLLIGATRAGLKKLEKNSYHFWKIDFDVEIGKLSSIRNHK